MNKKTRLIPKKELPQARRWFQEHPGTDWGDYLNQRGLETWKNQTNKC